MKKQAALNILIPGLVTLLIGTHGYSNECLPFYSNRVLGTSPDITELDLNRKRLKGRIDELTAALVTSSKLILPSGPNDSLSPFFKVRIADKDQLFDVTKLDYKKVIAAIQILHDEFQTAVLKEIVNRVDTFLLHTMDLIARAEARKHGISLSPGYRTNETVLLVRKFGQIERLFEEMDQFTSKHHLPQRETEFVELKVGEEIVKLTLDKNALNLFSGLVAKYGAETQSKAKHQLLSVLELYLKEKRKSFSDMSALKFGDLSRKYRAQAIPFDQRLKYFTDLNSGGVLYSPLHLAAVEKTISDIVSGKIFLEGNSGSQWLKLQNQISVEEIQKQFSSMIEKIAAARKSPIDTDANVESIANDYFNSPTGRNLKVLFESEVYENLSQLYVSANQELIVRQTNGSIPIPKDSASSLIVSTMSTSSIEAFVKSFPLETHVVKGPGEARENEARNALFIDVIDRSLVDIFTLALTSVESASMSSKGNSNFLNTNLFVLAKSLSPRISNLETRLNLKSLSRKFKKSPFLNKRAEAVERRNGETATQIMTKSGELFKEAKELLDSVQSDLAAHNKKLAELDKSLNFSALLKGYGNILSQFESGKPNAFNRTQLLDQVQKTLQLVKAPGLLTVDFIDRISSKFSKVEELFEQGITILQTLSRDEINPRNIADFARYSYLKARYSKYTDVFDRIEITGSTINSSKFRQELIIESILKDNANALIPLKLIMSTSYTRHAVMLSEQQSGSDFIEAIAVLYKLERYLKP